MNKIYGNSFVLETIEAMIESGRLPHGFVIHGETGLGKKTIARYIAKTLLCEKRQSRPCGKCRSCINVTKGIHSDLIIPEQSGKLMTYTVETCRKICADAIIKPNDSDKKIYLFADADNIQIPAQNSLLKVIEEPPEFVYFIFTVKSRDSFLPTILSRVISLAASPCSRDECAAALAFKGFDSNQISKALSIFGGNIGMSVKYLENEDLQTIASLTKKATDSIINRDAYSLLVTLSSDILKDRKNAVTFLEMLDRVIRDAAVVQISGSEECIGCCPKASMLLSERISAASAEKIHNAIAEAADDFRANVNSSLIMSGLCGDILSY